jgi:hypothetical protein
MPPVVSGLSAVLSTIGRIVLGCRQELGSPMLAPPGHVERLARQRIPPAPTAARNAVRG